MNISQMQTSDYFIGLDIGTNSVGWCACQPDFSIVKKKRQHLWGSRLFEAANGAADCRGFRSQRRRIARRRERINLLQSLFSTSIAEVDQGFFQRLNDSFFFEEDKHVKQRNALFNDAAYNDKEYHQQYPTIYHLRHALMTSNEKFDIRLIYLAIHHIIKNRGHFLMKGENLSEVKNFGSTWASFCETVLNQLRGNRLSEECNLDNISADEVGRILTENQGLKEKKKKLSVIFKANNFAGDKSTLETLAGLICGSRTPFKSWCCTVFPEDNKDACSLKDNDYDAKKDEWAALLGDDMDILEKAKQVYDWSVLSLIFQDRDCLSAAKIQGFKQHHTELQLLKRVMSKIGNKELVFGNPPAKDGCNYSSYIGCYKRGGVKIKCKKCSYANFIKYIKSIVAVIAKKGEFQDDHDTIDLCNKLNSDDGTFLLVQRNGDNGVIPHQAHLEELKRILSNATKHYSFLNDKDEYGSVAEKIIKLMRFRIPFYVGPLNDAHKQEGNKGYCWIVRNNPQDKQKIYPWNFDQLVDVNGCAERFMERLSSKCSYIPTEDVLPNASLLYQKFMVLNEINNITIFGAPITAELKQSIFNHLFVRQKKVTRKQLEKFLIHQGVIKKNESDEIAGIDDEIKSNLSSYVSFTKIMHKAKSALPTDAKMEEAISAITKLAMEPDMLLLRIKKIFPDYTPDVCKQICAIPAKKWGRLSNHLLTSIIAEPLGSVIDALWSTNDNLMQLLSSRYSYQDLIDDYNDSCTIESSGGYQQVDELFLPPSVKRGVWQSLRIVKELKGLMGNSPKKIFIEMARGPEEKKRTISRKNRLASIFKDAQLSEYAAVLEDKTEGALQSDKLYLYFTQLCRCMYSGQAINIDDLANNQIYDIDHIIPYSKSNDDSLDNRVLVNKKLNSRKSDIYPIDDSIRNAQDAMWCGLAGRGLISKEKLRRLQRSHSLSDDEKAAFINRQLVETRQSSKAVARLLTDLYPESRVVYVKAQHVSEFRHQFGCIKLRNLNNHHHGKDAYLCCVTGQVYDEKFTKNPSSFVKSNEKYNLKPKKMFAYDIKRGGSLIWKGGEDGSLSRVLKMMARNDLISCRMPEIENGGFYDQNLLGGRNNDKNKSSLRSIKTSNEKLCKTDRYGGYNSIKTSYYFCVEHGNEKKRLRSLESIPVFAASSCEGSAAALLRYAHNNLGLINPRIIVDKICKGSKLIIDGLPLTIRGCTGPRIYFDHHLELVLSPQLQVILQQVGKVVAMNPITKNKNEKVNGNEKDVLEKVNYYIKRKELSASKLIDLYDYLLCKLEHSIYSKITPSPRKKMADYREIFCMLDIPSQCEILVKFLPFYQSNATESSINGKKITRIRYSKNLSKKTEVLLVHQSVTGVYSQVVNLLEI